MKAQEMFEKLGYKKIVDNEGILIYLLEAETELYDGYAWELRFIKEKKEIEIEVDVEPYMKMGLDEIKAINKQVEELGWNKE